MNKLALFALTGLAGLTLTSSPARADTPYCREYTRKVVVNHQVQEAYGTACRQPDGTWEIENENNPGMAVSSDEAVPPAPPPPDAQVTYVIQDTQPVYITPPYVHYRQWNNYDYYGYPYWYGYNYAPVPRGGYHGFYDHDHDHDRDRYRYNR